MERTILLLIATFTLTFTLSCQMQGNDAQRQLLKWEKEFAKAVVRNDADSGQTS